MIDYIFYLCVDILVLLAKITGTSYEFINILQRVLCFLTSNYFTLLILVLEIIVLFVNSFVIFYL